MTTLFLSYSSTDEPWANEIKSGLDAEGYTVFVDTALHGGPKWEPALWQSLRRARGLVFLCTVQWLDSPWCAAEVLLAREQGLKIFGIITADAEKSDRFNGTLSNLKDTQFIRLSRLTTDQAFRQLLTSLESEGLRDVFPPAEQPYPGLRAFAEGDADVYFGRDDDIAKVMKVLERRRLRNAPGFILVLGASGCGKSSLVRAGVLPRLKRTNGKPDGVGRWLIPKPVMGGSGLDGLVLALDVIWQQTGKASDPNAIRCRLKAALPTGGADEEAIRGLRELFVDLLAARRLTDGMVLLVLDQLEEVFATPEGSEQRAMLRLLLEASADPGSSVAVLATMRSDFLNAFQLFEGAAERYEEITLDPLPRSRFAEVIEGPARRFGLRLGEGLVHRLVEDTAYADAMPLLAFTLEKLYKECGADGLLEIQEYEKLFPEVQVGEEDGSTTVFRGVSAAIKHVADAILRGNGYIGLPADDTRIRDLRSAFYRQAQVGEEGQFTRRTARWSQMPDSCKPVLRQFVDQRLLVSSSEENKEGSESKKPEPTLGVAHEALFRVWDTLNGWLRADRKALVLKEQIEAAAAEWQAAGRAESRSWPEERILDAVRVIDDSGVSLDDVKDRTIVDAFLGPTKAEDLKALPRLTEVDDAMKGSGRYGEAWRLPLSHEARASTGVRLDLRGDHRRGVGLRDDGMPDIDWVAVKGGQVTIDIRANDLDPNSEVADRIPRHVPAFRIARYPVTVAQFQAFLDQCYGDGPWRNLEGFPLDLAKANWSPPKPRARHGNHPMDTVNWIDAMAFCHWLGRRRGESITLPTEFQWQLAAIGGDPDRKYPWGADWEPAKEPWRANTLESDLGRSTAVGMYPSGASPMGLLDMAGTIYEWCLNAFDDPANDAFAKSGEDRRVLRGGSWLLNQDLARSASRSGLGPDARNNSIGFRVVCSSPSTGH